MAFITTSDLQVVMLDTTFDTATTSLATSCITMAEDEIRKKLSNRYDINSDYFQTSTSTPPVLKTICTWLTQGYMYENLSRGGKDSYTRADRFLKKAEANLEEIAKFKVSLLDSSGAMISESTSKNQILSNTTDYSETFNEDDPKNWAVDVDKLNDIADDRD